MGDHDVESCQAKQGSVGQRMRCSLISDTVKSIESTTGWRATLEEGLAAAEDPRSRPIPIYTPNPLKQNLSRNIGKDTSMGGESLGTVEGVAPLGPDGCPRGLQSESEPSNSTA